VATKVQTCVLAAFLVGRIGTFVKHRSNRNRRPAWRPDPPGHARTSRADMGWNRVGVAWNQKHVWSKGKSPMAIDWSKVREDSWAGKRSIDCSECGRPIRGLWQRPNYTQATRTSIA